MKPSDVCQCPKKGTEGRGMCVHEYANDEAKATMARGRVNVTGTLGYPNVHDAASVRVHRYTVRKSPPKASMYNSRSANGVQKRHPEVGPGIYHPSPRHACDVSLL